jgi:hypothetical protein
VRLSSSAYARMISGKEPTTLMSLLHMHPIECRPKHGRQFGRVIIGPEMHEEEARRFIEHVAVKRRQADPSRTQRADDRIHLGGGHHEVSADRRPPAAGGLEVDRRGRSHRRRHFVAVLGDRLRAGDAELIDATVRFAGIAEDAVEIRGGEVERRSRRYRRRGRPIGVFVTASAA